ncbi:hypothetical protein [Acidocella sp.]|uniref:hypothetical protein n=1 Tax=Acidocella sp. TaxID=50710 RepID=UPI003CFC48DD
MRFLASVSLLAALAGATPALANGLISRTPVVHVAVTGVESQAQLSDQLHAQGYDHIRLSAFSPSLANPHPELTTPDTSALAQTPVHEGWNGTAEKAGSVYDVYVGG